MFCLRTLALTATRAGLGVLTGGTAAQADMVSDFTGTCLGPAAPGEGGGGVCTGTATGVLTLTNAYVPGANITAADFVSFSYMSNAFSYTLIPDPSQPFDNFATVGGLNADGSINGAGDLNFFAVQGNRPLFQSGGFGPQQQWVAIPQGCYGVITSCADSGSSFKFSPLVGAPTPAPEPSTWAMMLLGFAGLGFAGYRASRKSAALAA